jgi:hypothetical protein
VTTLYEKQGILSSKFSCDYPLTKENVQLCLQEKYGIITWASHGNPTGSYRRWWSGDSNQDYIPNPTEIRSEYYITSNDVSGQSSNMSSILFSCSCLNAYPNQDDNLGKTLLKQGAVCFIGATRESIYFPGWQTVEDGGNMGITYHFFSNLINGHQSSGSALYNALTDSWYQDSVPVFKNILVFNLYGDPSLSLTSFPSLPEPSQPDEPNGLTTIEPKTPATFTTTTSYPYQPIYYLWDWGEGPYELTGPHLPDEEIAIQHSWSIPGEYLIKVKTINCIGDQSEWSYPHSLHVKGPILTIDSVSGTLLKLNVVLINNGEETGEDINWSITLEGGMLLSGAKSIGAIHTLSPGEKSIIISDLILGFGREVNITVIAWINNGSKAVSQRYARIMFPFIFLQEKST